MRAVVVSLPDSDRRERFFAQPQAEQFVVFDAFNGREQDWSPYFDAEAYESFYGSPPTPGQIGCAISHYQIIREFAQEAGPDEDLLLVAEDDGSYSEDFSWVLAAISARPFPYDVVVLGDSWSREPRRHLRLMLMANSQLSFLSRRIVTPGRSYRLGRFAGPAYSTGLYLMTRRGARKFLDRAQSAGGKLAATADDWVRFRNEWGLDVGVLRPSLAEWEGASSTRSEESLRAEAEAVGTSQTLVGCVRDFLALGTRMKATRLLVIATRDDIRHRMTRSSGNEFG